MTQQTINHDPAKTWQDEDFIGLSKRQVEALCSMAEPTYVASMALRQVSATNVENVRMFKVGSDHVVVTVKDNSGVVRWGVMHAAGAWVELRSQLNPMEIDDWDFARAQARAIDTLCFYSNAFKASKRPGRM